MWEGGDLSLSGLPSSGLRAHQWQLVDGRLAFGWPFSGGVGGVNLSLFRPSRGVAEDWSGMR
jgi:hypothetical protein